MAPPAIGPTLPAKPDAPPPPAQEPEKDSRAPAEPALAESETEPAASKPVPAAEEDVPDWLLSLPQVAIAPEQTAPAAQQDQVLESAEELAVKAGERPAESPDKPSEPPAESPAQEPDTEPDWLKLLKQAPPQVEEPAGPSSQSAVPDWLQQMREEESGAEPSAQGGASSEPEDPPWIQRMREEVASAASEPGSTPAEEEPSWIRHLQSEEEAPASSEEEAPDWLEQLSALTPEAPTAAEVGQAAEEMPAAEPAVEEMPAAEVGQAAEEMPAAEVGQPAEEMPTAEPAAEEMPAAEVEPAAEEMPAAEVGPELAETTAHQAPPPVEGLTAPKLPLLEEVPPPDHVPSAEETLASDVELPTRIEEPAGPPVEPSAPVAAETVEAEKPPEPRVRDEAAVPQAETLEHAVELPDWLKQMRAAQPETAESLEAFLAEQTPPTEEHPAEQPVEGQPAASVEGTTASLREKEPAGETEQAPSELEDIPDWLRVPISTPAQGAIEGPSTAAERAPTETEPVPAIEPARPEEVPSWIAALKPAELLEPSTPADLPIEASGPLAGLRGILPLALAITEPHPPVRPSVPGDGQNGAHLFTSILAQPAAEAEEPVAPQVRGRWTIRPFIYILLLLAVIVPFFLPAGLAGAAVPIVNTPAAEFYDVIQRLPSDAVVLVAFDYDPSVAGEMDLQANAIVRDLVKRRIKVIALSTLETGPFLAQHILEQATSGNSNYVYGIDYVNAGYLPGHEAGLAQLAASGFPANGIDFVQSSPLKQLPLISNLDLSRVSLVVELAGSEEPLKMWMEQFQGRGHVPVVAGVSAAVEPRARAYRAANQLVGVLSGLNGAAQYEILSNRTGLALTSVNAQGAAQLVLAFIIILGNIAFLISRRATGQND